MNCPKCGMRMNFIKKTSEDSEYECVQCGPFIYPKIFTLEAPRKKKKRLVR